MTKKAYDQLPRAAARARDREIIAGLTSWPAYIPEWDEYACVSQVTGAVYYGETARDALQRRVEAEEIYREIR